MFLSRFKNLSKTISLISTCTVLVLVLASCSSDSGGGASLDGDLRYLVEGSEGETVSLSATSFTKTEGNFETLGSVTIESTGTAEGDLEDGDFSGYQLQATSYGSEDVDITLKLLGDGDVLGETSETNSEGIYMVEVGDIPSYEDFQ